MVSTFDFRPSTFILSLMLIGAIGARNRAQSPSTDPSAVPVEQEPRHHLVFSNDYVRVIDALLPGLYVSQNHTHAADHVTVTILSGRDDGQGQARIGQASFARGGYSHVITNPATGPMRFIDVELRAADHGSGEDTPQPSHVTILSNKVVRITRVRIDAGQPLAGHQHVNGYMTVVVRGGEGPGTWRWHPAGEAAATLDGGRQALEFVEIEAK
jgi:hypothetical protein